MTPRLAAALAATMAGGLALGCDATALSVAADAGVDGATPAAPYAIVVLPDTQYYASGWPDVFLAQSRWLAENRAAQQIAFVLHTGDIVDSDRPEQWDVASRALHALDGQLPYVISAGNHDYTNLADRMGMGNSYFPPAGFAQYPWFLGTFEPGHVENSASLFTVPSGRWLVLALEFGPRDEVLAWADGVLRTHADTPAIVITHAYLYHDGTRYDHLNPGPAGQRYNPHDYVMMGQPGTTINDGQEMWTKLVEPHSNVKLVFSGHDVKPDGLLPPGTAARLTSTRADGTRVHQLLANYQTCTAPSCDAVHGGNGFLRVLGFSPGEHTVSVRTYSPYLDQSLTDATNEFTLEAD